MFLQALIESHDPLLPRFLCLEHSVLSSYLKE